MKKITIAQKMSGTGSIHDLASDLYDRNIGFKKGEKYAVVLAAYYGGKGYTTHRTAEAALQKYQANADYSKKIIDHEGRTYDVNGNRLAVTGWID